MIRSILLGSVFVVVIFLLLPDNLYLNNLGTNIIVIYFFVSVIYFFGILILWLVFKIYKPFFEDIDEFIYEKYLKKYLVQKFLRYYKFHKAKH